MCKYTNITDTATYSLSVHMKLDGSEHGCKDTNTTDTATYSLSVHKKWYDSEHECSDTTPQTPQLTACWHQRNAICSE